MEEEFNGIEKDRSKRANRRRARARKIKSRKRKMVTVLERGKDIVAEGSLQVCCCHEGHPWHDGRLNNNTEMNRHFGCGLRTKVNVRKSHSNYRHPIGYGVDKNWPANAKRQIERYNQQLKEFQMGE